MNSFTNNYFYYLGELTGFLQENGVQTYLLQIYGSCNLQKLNFLGTEVEYINNCFKIWEYCVQFFLVLFKFSNIFIYLYFLNEDIKFGWLFFHFYLDCDRQTDILG